MILILMGVSGAGKTTLGQALSTALNWPFFDGDAFHGTDDTLVITENATPDDYIGPNGEVRAKLGIDATGDELLAGWQIQADQMKWDISQ